MLAHPSEKRKGFSPIFQTRKNLKNKENPQTYQPLIPSVRDFVISFARAPSSTTDTRSPLRQYVTS